MSGVEAPAFTPGEETPQRDATLTHDSALL